MAHREKMDIPRGPTIALPLPTTDTHAAPRRRLSHSTSQFSSGSAQPSVGMAIPGARTDHIPPALPPPRYNHDLDQGIDLAWNWQNEDLMTGKSKLAPIKPGSSLLGTGSRPQLPRDDLEHLEMEPDFDRNPSRPSVRAAPSPSRSHVAAGTFLPNLVRSPPSSSGISQRFDRLPGENPLAQQNHHQSIHAYDKHLLLKIGKSNSPPGHYKSALQEKGTSTRKLSIQTRGPNLLLRPVTDQPSTFDPVTKWMTSPTSAVSLSSRNSWRDYSMDPRSPSSDTPSHSTSIDPDYFPTPNIPVKYTTSRSSHRQSPEGGRYRSERGSYDSAVYAGEFDYTGDGTSFDSLHIEERPRPAAGHGVKRRALSPTQEFTHEQGTEAPTARVQRVPNVQAPAPRQPYRAGSLSSTPSSAQFNSFVSSNVSSLAPSSMTSFSSIGTSVSHEKNPLLPISQTPRSTSGLAQMALSLRPPSDNSASEMSTRSPAVETRTLPARIGNHYICSCCPKKPKKFENEEQLRTHENEKQYTCAYCNNRFKNKNEAERHQNSLHLRKQSWSCAAISTYEAAFHPSSFSHPRNLVTDVCGFCGDEFANSPLDWDERIDHLNSVHKFGECNASKKFYRADHFRQHLKHSHAGKSGKWTNILENNCQREEAISESASLSPTASEHSQGGSGGRLQIGSTNPADMAIGGVDTIDEVYEES